MAEMPHPDVQARFDALAGQTASEARESTHDLMARWGSHLAQIPAGLQFEKRRLLSLLERGHAEAEEAMAKMRADWDAQDKEYVAFRAAQRARIVELHEQGALARDARRVELGGTSLAPPPVEAAPAPEPAPAEEHVDA